MRSRSEQRIWDDIERFHAAEAAEPVLPGPHPARRRDGRGVDDPPVAVVAGTWCAIPLILFGAVVIGLAIGAATALGWLLWRSWPSLRDPDTTSAVPASRSSYAITADVYSHVGPAQQREAADRLDKRSAGDRCWPPGRVAVRVAAVMRDAGRPLPPTRL